MQTNYSTTKNEQGINVVDLFLYLVSKWKWYVLSGLIFVGLAWYKYEKSPFMYSKSAMVVIKDPSNKTYSAGLDRYDNYINRVNVSNEILQFRSNKLMAEVVKRTNADVSYKYKERFRNYELYKSTPVIVSFINATPNSRIFLDMEIGDGNNVKVSNFNGEDKVYDVKLNDTVCIGDYKIILTPTNYFGDRWKDVPIKVVKSNIEAIAGYYKGALQIFQAQDDVSILTLSLKDNSPKRAEAVLNTLINVYNEEAINIKNQVAIKTANFINERIIIIEKELGGVESDLESFKKANKIIDLGSAAASYVSDSQKYNAEALEQELQLEMAKYIKGYLTDPSKEIDLIPTNTGIKDMNIEGLITQYNNVKLRRDRLKESSSDRSPVVQELNNQLLAMKQNIIRAVDNMIVSINVKLKDAQNRRTMAQARVSSIPGKEREMLTIERQQKIKESLFLYLLNKREENGLTQAMAENNARIIDSSLGGDYPISPNRKRVILLGLLIALAIPTAIFFLILFLDTRVHSKKDIIKAVTVPFLGEIPFDKDIQKERKDKWIVREGGDDMASEAFRILRTNMSFMTNNGEKVKVITFTSFNEGAGKTFISSNLTMSLVYAKKKVVVIDLDIRKGTLSSQVNKHSIGMTNYLSDSSISVSDILQKDTKYHNLSVITAGPLAPNPAELLMSDRLDLLIEELRKDFDYIIADNVPIGIIADATIANRIADLTIFVVRANKLDRRQLPDIEALYRDKKLNNMAIVLNGSNPKERGYGYGYGHSYGYGYGYGYGKKK